MMILKGVNIFYFLSFHFLMIQGEVTFKYVTLYNKEGRQMKKDDLGRTSVNVLKPIIFIMNGLDSSDNAWLNEIVNEYLEKQIHNVFIVDWEFDSKMDQDKINSTIEPTSLTVAEFIHTVYNVTQSAYLDIHLVGIFSGFQVSNVVAKRISEFPGRRVNRITGLDPTYYLVNDEVEARKGNSQREIANSVDVVHSNFRKPGKELTQWGHVDFYIDDEKCEKSKDTICGKFDSVKMFSRSINSESYKAVPCSSIEEFRLNKCKENDVIIFGENVPRNATGIYFIKFETI